MDFVPTDEDCAAVAKEFGNAEGRLTYDKLVELLHSGRFRPEHQGR